MTQLQGRLLEMLDSFHHLCLQNGFRYYIIGGTALGAVRHGGFIPWDDDIDVGMPRPDYERLREWSRQNVFGRYVFEFPGESGDFVYPFGKMYDTTTTLIENTRFKTRRGIYIDIFPLDGVGATKEESLRNFRKIDRFCNLLSTKVCAYRKSRKWYKNLSIVLMRVVPVSIKWLMTVIDRMSKERDYDKCAYVANFVGNWHEREIFRREWLGDPVECDFNGIKTQRPENVDAFLTAMYGDWRTPPPPEKQVSHHDYLEFDIDKPYK